MAQWITRLPTEQKIPGSSPGKVGIFDFFLKLSPTACRERFASLFQSSLFFRENLEDNKCEMQSTSILRLLVLFLVFCLIINEISNLCI